MSEKKTMKNTEQKIPALRFPEFTGEWEEKRLGEIVDYVKGYAFKSDDYKENGVRIIRVSDLNESSIKDNEDKVFISESTAQKYSKYLIKLDDIIITTVGSKPNVIASAVGKGILVKKSNEGLLNQNMVKFSSSDKIINPFLFGYINSHRYKLFINSIHRGNANQSNITLEDLFLYKVFLTTPNEQQKIANFLSAVDKRLQLLKDKKTKLEEYKRGVMQRIFSQELRFTRPDGSAYPDWEEKRLGEITEIIMGQSPDSAYYNEKGIGEVLIQGNADIKNRETTKRLWTTQITKKCLFNDLILTVRAPVGSIAKATFTACIGRGVCAIRPKSTATVNFLFQTLIVLEPSWRRLEQGSTFTSVNSTDINNFKIKLPHIDEQRQIADFLSAIDDKISLLSKQIQSTEQYKKGLLQQMFV